MTITYIFPKITNEECVNNHNKSTESTNKNIKDIIEKFSNLEKEIEKLNYALHRILDILKINGSIYVFIKDEYLNSKNIIALLKQLYEEKNMGQDFDYFEKSEKSFMVEIRTQQEKAIA